MNVQDAIANIEQRQAETRTFCAEAHRPDAVVWPFAIGGIIVGAALFGAGMAFAKVIGA